jgi:4-deoxy-L-threo-5-hexosulose-uronate ketol-isomerase
MAARTEQGMETRWTADPTRYLGMNTRALREAFLIDSLAAPGELRLTYVDLDRAVVGMASPLHQPLALPADALLRADFFLERREMGALNIGGAGAIRVGATTHAVGPLDCLYLGRDNSDVTFQSVDPASPAVFYLLSYPAHHTYPSTLIRKEDAQPMELGGTETANRRTVYKYIHQQGAQSCQLVMGVTHLQPGSIWNTMPPHTHTRRSEIYMYFNLAGDDRVMHLMGTPQETRHLTVANREVVVSPGWSIHAGAGSRAYSFCWGMGGENQDYADMDRVTVAELR